jgi:hypothetical protein
LEGVVTWQTEDGGHEGWVAARFADGAISGSTGPAGYRISYLADGTEVGDRDEWRADDAVVGWVGACTCGWRSRPWDRVATRTDEDVTARRAFGDYVTPDGRMLFDEDRDVVTDAVHAEWRTHVQPHQALADVAALAREHAEVGHQLADAVGRARAVGASWTDIGAAAGITRQSAHERWRNVPVPAAIGHQAGHPSGGVHQP